MFSMRAAVSPLFTLPSAAFESWGVYGNNKKTPQYQMRGRRNFYFGWALAVSSTDNPPPESRTGTSGGTGLPEIPTVCADAGFAFSSREFGLVETDVTGTSSAPSSVAFSDPSGGVAKVIGAKAGPGPLVARQLSESKVWQ